MDSMTEEASNASVQVEIFGQPFKLCGSDPDYMLDLAAYVDGKMRAVGEVNSTTDSARLALLVALNIADEYHLLKANLEGFSEEASQRVRERRKLHHTYRWYCQQLLDVAEGKRVMSNKEYKALIAFGRARGWNRRPPGSRRKNRSLAGNRLLR